MALYYVTTSGSVPASYASQGYVLAPYSGANITVEDGSTYVLAPDLSGTITFEPPDDDGTDPNHPFNIQVDQSNANLNVIRAVSVGGRGDLVPSLTVADSVDISSASIEFQATDQSTTTIGANSKIADFHGGTEQSDHDTLNLGDNVTTGVLEMGGGGDSIIIGDNVTTKTIDLGFDGDGLADYVTAGTGVTVIGDILQPVADDDSYLDFGESTVIIGSIDLNGGRDVFGIGDNSTVNGTIELGATTSVRDADWLIVGRNSNLAGKITTGDGNDTIFFDKNVSLLAGGTAVDTYSGSDTIYIGTGFSSFGAIDMGVGLPNDDLLEIEHAHDLTAFNSSVAAAGLSDGDGDGIYSGAPNVTYTWNSVTFLDVDNVKGTPCFVTGTLIDTVHGPRPIETITPGDLVWTRDNGLQPLRWTAKRRMSLSDLLCRHSVRPIRIRAGALGPNLPKRDLRVSPQHRVLVRSAIAQRMFECAEVLVPAVKLLGLPGFEVDVPTSSITYIHLLFDQHEVIRSEGAETESLYTGPEALKSISPAARKELETLFPELLSTRPPPARPFAQGRRAGKLAARHKRNGQPLHSSAVSSSSP